MFLVSEKIIKKWRKEDIDLHKRVLTTYLIQQGLDSTIRKKFFLLYDNFITPENILNYFHKPSKIFVQALVCDQLDAIQDYNQKPKTKKRKRHES